MLFVGINIAFSQQLELDFFLIDATTQEAISDAHLFISDASVGSVSDRSGRCQLSISSSETQVLIVTHVSYETQIINPETYRKLVDGAKVSLKSNGIAISEIQVTAKRGRKWKQNFRKFKRAFLGTGDPASKCEILNPEVLRFSEKDGTLQVTAIDLLEIDNKYLGYHINFWLDELVIEADGSQFYKGHGQYIDKNEERPRKQKKLRAQIYQNSLAHFLTSLSESPDKSTLRSRGYQLSIDQYAQGNFTTVHIPEPTEIVLKDNKTGLHKLQFPAFLTVRHVKLKSASAGQHRVNISGAEQQKFGTDRTQSISSGATEVSRLYKVKPFLLFDNRGNIINKSAVKEYGYWADQRIATTLPIDYYNASSSGTIEPDIQQVDTLDFFLGLISNNSQKQKAAVEYIQSNWTQAFIAPLLDILGMWREPWLQKEITILLAKHAPEITPDYFLGSQQLWENPPNYARFYADFKAHLYKSIDPAFFRYFNNRVDLTKIRLDEIAWGGVKQDGIPPLRSPKMISAEEAEYLADSDVVFTLVLAGEARAYPQRILAWHEFFTDEIAGKSIAGVYCTLCGTVIIYNTEYNGIKHQLGTSGFLYRSNKLMYDKATQSLWSTILGQPVVGPLVNEGIDLPIIPVETATWGEWKKLHPETRVLSLETGHRRNYDEGEAYKEYYSSDALMFPVPLSDDRLPNKARVFIPRTSDYQKDPLCISINYLKRKRLHQDEISGQDLLILTEKNGSSRAYAIEDTEFKSYKKGILKDKAGEVWEIDDNQLIGPLGEHFERLPAHESFWFAWFNTFPETRLVD